MRRVVRCTSSGRTIPSITPSTHSSTISHNAISHYYLHHQQQQRWCCIDFLDHLEPPQSSGAAMGAYLLELVHRSSYARERLRERIKEPSLEIALKNLIDYTDLRKMSPAELEQFSNVPDVQKVELLLDSFEAWYLHVKAPQKVRMEEPWDWFPMARQMRRRFVFHAGPTNSGKTHEALEKLMSAKSGVYCAPLKALAAQVWRTVDARVPCDLLIGDERQFAGSAEHVACTTEMTPVDNLVDVGVIDEIQMISDDQRGWAWTRALLGLPAKEIHLCGEERALSVVRQLLYKTNESRFLKVRNHERLVPLHLTTPLKGRYNSADLRNGDCIVAFGRKKIFEIQKEIEESNRSVEFPQDRCATHVIYGGLPFAVRERESDEFNNGVCIRYDQDRAARGLVDDVVGDNINIGMKDGGQQVKPPLSPSPTTPTPPSNKGTIIDTSLIKEKKHILVTTDAIAYGLNMNIRRIVLTETRKYDGKGMIDLPQSTVLQVAGRAGRFGLKFSKDGGMATTLHARDLHTIRDAFDKPLPVIQRAGLLPTADILAIYADIKRKEGIETFSHLMKCFNEESSTNQELLFPCDMTRSILAIARTLDDVTNLSLRDRVLFCFVPLAASSNASFNLLRAYAESHAAGKPVSIQVDTLYLVPIEEYFSHPDGPVQTLLLLTKHKDPSKEKGGGGDGNKRVAVTPSDIARIQRYLTDLEWSYKMVEMYGWLSWRFRTTFEQQEEAKGVKQRIVAAIEVALSVLHVADEEGLIPPKLNHHYRRGNSTNNAADANPPAPVYEVLQYKRIRGDQSQASSSPPSSTAYNHQQRHQDDYRGNNGSNVPFRSVSPSSSSSSSSSYNRRCNEDTYSKHLSRRGRSW